MTDIDPSISRRTFMKATGALGALAAASGSLAAAEHAFADTEPAAEASEEKIVWSQCNVNCGGRCIFKWHVKDGKIQYMETDDTGDDEEFQARACLRGRSMRQWLNHPDRLQYPMKRVGKRGEGKFERISWDEAIQTIADKLKYTIETYGNDAVYVPYATGMYSATGKNHPRLLNALGGYLSAYGDYSTGMHQYVMPFMYGGLTSNDPADFPVEGGSVPYENIHASSMDQAEKADLVIMFGNSPAENRMGGINMVWDFNKVRESGAKIIHVDYRLNETASGSTDEWLPIRTGTDAALVSAVAHELIVNNQVDLDFLHTYCVGYDEETMPKSAKGKNLSYKDYIMGTGYDMVEKTPEWAAPITLIPAQRIREFAQQIAEAQTLFVVQGWGLQRHSNGETATRAVCMLPVLTGQLGLPGTNTGMREAEPVNYLVGSIPSSDEGWEKKTSGAMISTYEWLNAVDHGTEMRPETDAIIGAPNGLPSNIKFMWNYAGNCLTNQHADINKVHEILSDESKCEFILVWDTVMTDTARYADILLPDAMRSEQLNMGTQGYAEYYSGVTVGGPAQDPPFECRPSYDVNAEIADKLGVKDKFTAGLTQEGWIESLYKAGAKADPEMPSWEEILEQGVYKRKHETAVGLSAFREDPKANPLMTPTGKIEIYSEALANIAEERVLKEGEVISPIPSFDPGIEGYGSVTDEFPLYCSGWHDKARTHSSFGFIEQLDQYNRHRLWVNPVDAQPRGISDGDTVSVKSPAGEVRIEAHVTSRIVPSMVAMPQGHWHKAEMYGDQVDEGACINTLTTYRPSPLAHGNGACNSIIVEVAKA